MYTLLKIELALFITGGLILAAAPGPWGTAERLGGFVSAAALAWCWRQFGKLREILQ